MKGLLLFLMQVLVIGIELRSGYWIEYFAGLVPRFSLRLHGGFFTKGIWGLITLGSKAGAKNGDHSTMLLISGIITVLVILLFLSVYLWNLKDAYRTGKQIDETGIYISSKEYLKKTYSKFFPYVILIPIIILVAFIIIMPIAFSILTAFTNYNKNHLPPASLIDWVGFSNFIKLFKVPIWTNTFLSVFAWTVIWAVCATFSTYFMGMLQAVLLNSRFVKFKSLYRSIMILPWAIPQMISLLVFKNLLNGQFGPLGQLLIDLGLTDQRIPFLSDPTLAKIIVILVNLWMGFPMFMIMIQGILSNIDKGLYEAAEIDGAGSWQVFRKITFPLVFKATGPLLVMNFAGNFNGFGAIYFLTEGGPVNPNYQLAGDTDILISWIYKLTLNHQIYDMAAVKEYLLSSIRYWTTKFDIDGWRLDVSDEIDHTFWRDFHILVKSINKDIAIIGENWHNTLPWLMGDQFDSIMNYPVTKLCLDFFARRQTGTKEFENMLSAYLMRYPDQINEALLNLLDSHDTERFLYTAGERKESLKNAAAFLFAYKGMPCTYYGTEIGMTGCYDPGCRKGFDWRQENWDMELYQLYRKLIATRKEEKALKYGSLKFVSTDRLFALKRSYGNEIIYILINNTDSGQEYIIPAAGPAVELLKGGIWQGEAGHVKVAVPANNSLYLKLTV